jgi:elongation factor P
MKEQANQIRPGWVLQHNGKQYMVSKINLIQPGKGGAFIAVEMRDIVTGVKTQERWRTVDSVEKLLAEDKNYQFLYAEGDDLVFMDEESYEQINVSKDILGDRLPLLQDGMKVIISSIEGKPVSIQLPKTVVAKIVETEPVVKGQTATGSFKPAILDNGIRVMVPQFIDADDDIVILTDDLTYVERAKK